MPFTHTMKDIVVNDREGRHFEHETLISRPCSVQLLMENERMILNFDMEQLRTSVVEEITVTGKETRVLTHNTCYVLEENI